MWARSSRFSGLRTPSWPIIPELRPRPPPWGRHTPTSRRSTLTHPPTKPPYTHTHVPFSLLYRLHPPSSTCTPSPTSSSLSTLTHLLIRTNPHPPTHPPYKPSFHSSSSTTNHHPPKILPHPPSSTHPNPNRLTCHRSFLPPSPPDSPTKRGRLGVLSRVLWRGVGRVL